MLLEGARGSPAAMLTAMPYLISLAIPTNDGGTLRAECGGAAPGGAARVCEADSGYAVAMNQRGQMVVSLPAAGRPAAGRYTENLEITLSVKQ
jgi:hypothetical protein